MPFVYYYEPSGAPIAGAGRPPIRVAFSPDLRGRDYSRKPVDSELNGSMRREIVIVGGGLSGTTVAIRLLRALQTPARITVFDPSGQLGRGVAYGTECGKHLLNVRAIGMSLFPENPEDFVQWLSERDHGLPDPVAKQFAPRMVYREYVQQRVAEAAIARASSVDFEVVPHAAQVLGSHGEIDGIPATDIVLALGNLPPAVPGPFRAIADSHRIITDPWHPGALDDLPAQGSILIIGAGLTMIDVVIKLREDGFTGPIVALSRRGLMPHAHEDVAPTPQEKPESQDALDLLRTIRRRAAEADWRSVIDGLRPHNQSLWQGLPVAEKKRFAAHLQTFWDIHRHRIAPSIAQVIANEIDAGTLQVIGGRVRSVRECLPGVEVTVALRSGKEKMLLADRIINCTGPSGNWKGARHPLLAQLVEGGLARWDELGMGIAVDANCRCVATLKTPATYAIGPITKGTFWESTAAPEIRVQAANIARQIAAT